jgi:hypothetical protein
VKRKILAVADVGWLGVAHQLERVMARTVLQVEAAPDEVLQCRQQPGSDGGLESGCRLSSAALEEMFAVTVWYALAKNGLCGDFIQSASGAGLRPA